MSGIDGTCVLRAAEQTRRAGLIKATRVAGGAANASLPVSWMAAVVAGTVVVVAALTLFPARAGARRPVAAVLRSD